MDKQQRNKELQTLARENNWLFSPKADISNVSILTEFEFHTGEKRKIESIKNLIKAENVKIFDVYWKKEFDPLSAVAAMMNRDLSAQNAKYQTMFLIESNNLKLPLLHIYPTKSVSLIEQWMSKAFQQTDFQNYPNFEKRWTVRTSDKNIFNNFDKKLIEVYETSEDFWTFGKDKFLVIYQTNILVEVNKVLDWIEKLNKISISFENS